MTNEQAKQEAIKKAYGDSWDKVKELVRDFDGTIETFPFLMQEGHESDGFYWRELGLSYDDIEDVYGDCEPSRWRPKSLKSIETNASWTRIEPDGSNLPESGCKMKWLSKSSEMAEITMNSTRAKDTLKTFTHYKPIEKELLPIY